MPHLNMRPWLRWHCDAIIAVSGTVCSLRHCMQSPATLVCSHRSMPSPPRHRPPRNAVCDTPKPHRKQCRLRVELTAPPLPHQVQHPRTHPTVPSQLSLSPTRTAATPNNFQPLIFAALQLAPVQYAELPPRATQDAPSLVLAGLVISRLSSLRLPLAEPARPQHCPPLPRPSASSTVRQHRAAQRPQRPPTPLRRSVSPPYSPRAPRATLSALPLYPRVCTRPLASSSVSATSSPPVVLS